jgi:hypothetical protein
LFRIIIIIKNWGFLATTTYQQISDQAMCHHLCVGREKEGGRRREGGERERRTMNRQFLYTQWCLHNVMYIPADVEVGRFEGPLVGITDG